MVGGGSALGSRGYRWIGVVDDNGAPHFQQTANVGGFPLPQLGQTGLLDKSIPMDNRLMVYRFSLVVHP